MLRSDACKMLKINVIIIRRQLLYEMTGKEQLGIKPGVEGHSEKAAKELIACVVISEIFDVMKNEEEFNLQRYVDALNKLPPLPWD